jgi:hypothetical protein
LEPASGVWRPFPNPDGSIRRALAGVRPPELAECWQLYRSLYLTRGEKPRDAAWTSLIPVETCRPLLCEPPGSPLAPAAGSRGLAHLAPDVTLANGRPLVVKLSAARHAELDLRATILEV